MKEIGPQVGSACAFKWDLKAKVDEPKDILLPMHGILWFSNEDEHPRVDFGAREEATSQSIIDCSSVFHM